MISAQTAERLSPPGSLVARSWKVLRRLGWAADRLSRGPARQPANSTGVRGEEIAYWSLRQHGYTIVARNFRLAGREGELDLVAFEGAPPTLVFVEVKTRTALGWVPAEAAVDADKRRHMIRLARAYRRRRGHDGPYRFDVVAVYGPQERTPKIELYRDAFRDGGRR